MNNSALIGLLSTVITGMITYLVTKSNNKKDVEIKREEYVDTQLRELVKLYKEEVSSLKSEMKELVEENKLLRTEIISLKEKLIELEGGMDLC